MSDPALKPIEPMDDADLDDPDTALVEALRDSSRPGNRLRAQELARKKLAALGQKLQRRESPAHGMRAVKR